MDSFATSSNCRISNQSNATLSELVSKPPPIPKRRFNLKTHEFSDKSNIKNLNSFEMCDTSSRKTELNDVVLKRFRNADLQRRSAPFQNTIVEHVYNDSTDAEVTSDEDRASLENSVFDESTSSTPIKYGVKVVNKITNETSSTMKRTNRSSCSTVDSVATTSSGYGTNSERLASTSTVADNRSRLSSVDTQSSIESCLAEKSSDYSVNKDKPRIARSTFNEFLNNLNNNKITLPAGVPAIPQRKKNSSKIIQNNIIHDNNIDRRNASNTSSTVTSSNSSSSTGSGTLSGSSMSISVTNSNSTISPIFINSKVSMIGDRQYQNKKHQKRSTPPTPPLRLNQTTRSISCNVTQKALFKFPSLEEIMHHKNQHLKFAGTKDTNINDIGISVENCLNATSTDNYDYSISRLVNFNFIPTMTTSQLREEAFHTSCKSDENFVPKSGGSSKLVEAPSVAHLNVKKDKHAPVTLKNTFANETLNTKDINVLPLTKCVSTPASLQTIVRFQNGTQNTMSFPHQIVSRKSSNPYITHGRLKFRLFQILLNAFALLVIAGGLAAYFNAYPTIKFVNKTIINTIHVEDSFSYGKNPAPGTCLPIIVKFCQGVQIPYNYTVFPNYIGHFGQLETQTDLDAYEALVDVRCYELVSLFLCSLFVPKCGPSGATVPPCKSLCTETMRRCGFFFDVFGLSLPEYLNCKLFKDFESPDDCVGLDEVREVMIAASNPTCDGFQCDHNRCIPKEYVCDGNLDCMDQADEASCKYCKSDEIYCGEKKCIGVKNICDGIIDCPYGQDERNCIRLSESNGDLGRGVLEVYRRTDNEWTPACVKNWDKAVSPSVICSLLGYNSVNATNVVTQKTRHPMVAHVNSSINMWKMYSRKRSKMMQEFANCNLTEDYPIAELTCTNFGCGKVKRGRRLPTRRIIGGSRSDPGSWPFLAAILGGPEKIFYCAGVLISDQWVLTASHCIGNHTVIDLEDWTIQLGVTRRDSFTYTAQEVKVKMVIPHPQYNMIIAHDNDIALFQLVKRVMFHEHLLPVCLPPPNIKQLRIGQMCTVIGWGKREDKDPKSTYEPIINEVKVPIIKHSQCDEWFENLTVTEGMLCAGYEEGGKDACQGDSGGPLVCQVPGEKDKWFVGGIVSWGIQCANPKLPGVYANVIKYVPWIQEQMQKYSKPLVDENVSKYDTHPGGPDILSNLSNSPTKSRKPHYVKNRGPEEID